VNTKIAIVLGLSLVASSARAADRSGVRPEVLSTPKGPGSIEGLGEAFSPSPQTGAASYAVKIAVPPGVAGFAPQLAMHYSSGAGNGELGLGWSLGLPQVQRSTDRRLPHYDASDIFVLRGMGGAGAEELVQLADGSYRFRIEGAFVRGRQHADGTWEFHSASGNRFIFGFNVHDFAWQLTRQEDLFGNAINYEWEEQGGRAWLVRVTYGNGNEVDFTYESRADALTSYLAAFPMTTGRRLARITVLTGGMPVRTYELGYERQMGISRLVTVRMIGRDGLTALPTLSMHYAEPVYEAASVVAVQDGPARALGGTTELDDVDGDGLADVIVMDSTLDGGRYSYYPNLDGEHFGARQPLGSSPSVWLQQSGVQLADMDGDGAADVVARLSNASDGFRFYPANSNGFGASVTIAPNPSFAFDDPDVRLIDLDHDRRADWMRIDPTTGDVSVAFNLGGGQFSTPASLPRIDPTEVVSFSRTGLRFADMNGDGLQDLVAVRSGSLRYWPSLGFGRFGAAVDLPGAPVLDDVELAQVHVHDIDGDGLADLVHVGVSQVRVWLNQAGIELSEMRTIVGTPEVGTNTVVRLADLNGNGTADIVWVDPTSATPWRYLDVLGAGAPGLLVSIDNGLGRTTSITYEGLGPMRAWARDAGVDWTRRCAMGQMVVARLDVDDGLGERLTTELRYADAYFDGPTREFRGFGRAVQYERGDATQPTLLTDSRFDVGDSDEARKGLALAVTRKTEDGSIFDSASTEYEVRTLAPGVRYALARSSDTAIYEGGTQPKTVRRQWDRDSYGNVIHEAQLGDVATDGDETIIDRQYTADEGAWVVDRLTSEIVRAADGTRLSEKDVAYDDHFAPHETSTWIGGDYFGLVERLERDAHGNVRARTDGRGGRTEMDYDDSGTFVTAVRMEALSWKADHDRAFGGITRLVGPDGAEHRYSYDALGRPIAIIEPGDSDALPTRRFEYHFGTPLSYVRSEQRVTSGAADVETSIAYVDGMGRARGTFAPAGDGSWAASGLSAYGARGWARFAENPRFAGSADWLAADENQPGVRTEYDASGRPLRIVQPDGTVRRNEYAAFETRAIDENGRIVRRLADGQGRVREQIEAGVSTHYDYDARGKLVAVTDALGHVRRYGFDGRGRQVSVDDSNAGHWQLAYDDADGLIERDDPAGNIVRFALDSLGRTTEERHGDASAVRWTYDAAGRVAQVDDEAGSVSFKYDERGRVTDRTRRWLDSREHTTWTEYDAADRPVRRGFPDGTYLPIRYDARGLVAGMGGVVHDVRWTAWGALDAVTFGNGVADTREYDTRLRVTRMNAAGLRDLSFTFDPASMITRISDGRSGVDPALDLSGDYTYDDRYRLVGAKDRGGATTWTLDDVAKILSVKSDHTDAAFLNVTNQYGEDGAGPDQLTSFGDEKLHYDAAGRVIADGSRKITWDAKGRIARVERGDVVEEYVYGYDDARAIKRETRAGNTVETRYADVDVEERDGALVRYVSLGGKRVARLDAEHVTAAMVLAPPWIPNFFITAALAIVLLSRTRRARLLPLALAAVAGCADGTGSLHHDGKPIDNWPSGAVLYLGDHLDSIVAVANSDGQVISQTAYYPYGAIRAQSGDSSDPRGYVGNEADHGSGLSDFHARPYQPDTGSFLAVEPLALFPRKPGGSLPAYAYSASNPIILRDGNGDQYVEVVMRSYAPWKTFGGGYEGNDRGPSTAMQGPTSKLIQRTFVDVDTATFVQDMTTRCDKTIADTVYPWVMRVITFKGWPGFQLHQEATADASGYAMLSGDPGRVTLQQHIQGAMPLARGAPDIDVFSRVEMEHVGNKLYISGSLEGDGFPPAEMFVRDAAGTAVFLHSYTAPESQTLPSLRFWGPYLLLPGENHRNMGSFGASINLNEDGNFASVNYMGQTLSVDQWNSLNKADGASK
jgi:RHS repeat-associated protein